MISYEEYRKRTLEDLKKQLPREDEKDVERFMDEHEEDTRAAYDYDIKNPSGDEKYMHSELAYAYYMMYE